jgi:UDPglucose 6-dehydrogenase
MRVCVAGLWHLGSVTAACLAHVGHDVVAFDEDAEVVEKLSGGAAPVAEPGLDEVLRGGLSAGKLTLTGDRAAALAGADVLWIAYDTPVDNDDNADVAWVGDRVHELLAERNEETFVVVSSQLPVGTTRAFGVERIAYSPENLQLGRAVDAFLQPERVVVGIDAATDRKPLERLFGPITERIEWMDIESAELTKHALNAFLATSIAFANEIAVLSERVGADARDVARGLKSDRRIGPRSYLSPGAAFAGGTLARDVKFLTEVARREGVAAHLLSAVRPSNDEHLHWPHRAVASLLDGERGPVAVWGLVYKAGTDTLRRSSALELCRTLARDGIVVRAHDPAVHTLPADIPSGVTLCATPEDAVEGAQALVVATPWPEFRSVTPGEVISRMTSPNVVDAAGALAETLGSDERIRYLTVGKARA